jgi:DNA mismatch endonuclease, patch repair protein
MVDIVSKEIRSKTMRAIRSKDTKIECTINSKLREQKLRFKRNVNSLPGKPDFALKKYKLAVFVDSCFWHGCKLHCRMPQTNTDYWSAKITRNRKRDKKVNLWYFKQKWVLLRFWEHDIEHNLEKCVKAIKTSHYKQKGKLKNKMI